MDAPLLLYDADCGFCARAVAWVPRLQLRVTVRPLQSADLAGLGVDPARASRELPLVGVDGTVRYGHAAVAGALRTGRAGSRLASRLLLLWPIRIAARGMYRMVADHRHRLPGGTRACELPRRR